MIFSLSSFAGPGYTTYQAKIIKPDGQPLEASSVNFRFTILDPSASCILYSENYAAVNMAATGGLTSFALGSGVKVYPVSSTTFENVFSNITPSLSCDVGGPVSYSPLANDTRKIVMQFNDGGGWQTLPAMSINAVPYAMYASDAQKLGGVSATSFVQTSMIPSCGVSEAVQYNGTLFSCISVGSGAGGSTVTSASVITALGYTPADGVSITTVSNYASNVSSTVFSVSSTVSSLQNSFSSFQATTAASFSALSGSGIGSFNGSSSATQSLNNSLSGTTPAFVTANGVHTLNIPYASAVTTTAGLISSTEYSLFSTVVSKIASSAAAIAQVLGYTPADQVVVATLSSTVSSVSSTVSSLSSTITGKITSSAASVAQVLGYVPAASGTISSSQWTTSGSTINYNSGSVQIGNTPAVGTIDLGPLLGSAASYRASLLVQETATDFSNEFTTAKSSIFKLNSFAPSAGYVANDLNYTQNVAGNGMSYGSVNSGFDIIENNGSGNILQLAARGVYAFNNGSGPVTHIAGLNSKVYTYSGTSGNAYGGWFGSSQFGGTLLNNYGVKIDSAIGTATTNYGIYISDAGLMTTSYAANIFSSGSSSKNIFEGRVGVGGVYYPSAKLHLGAGTNSEAPFKLTSGTLLTSPTSGALEYDGFNLYYTDGTNTRRALAAAGAGVGTFNGSTSATQTLAAGNNGTAPSFSTVNGVHTLNIPFASAGATTAGLISNTDYVNFSNKISSQWTTSGTSIYYLSGPVGIGTSNPVAFFDVSSNGGYMRVGPNDGQLELGSSNDASSYIDFHGHLNLNADYTGRIEYKDGFGMNLTVNGNESPSLFIKESNGFVGIGSLAPLARLHISSGSTTAAPLRLTAGNLLASPTSGAIEYDGTNLYYTDNSNTRYTIAGTAVPGYFDAIGTIANAPGNIVMYPNLGNGSVVVSATTASTNANNGALIVKGGIGVAGNINTSGTVAIGTTNPSAAKLSVGEGYSSYGSGTYPVSVPRVVIATPLGASGTVTTALHLDAAPDTEFNKGLALEMGYANTGYGHYTSRIVHYGYNAGTVGSRLQIQTHSPVGDVWSTGLFMNEYGTVGLGTTTPAYDAPWVSPGLDISGTRGSMILRTTATNGISTLRMTGPSSGNDIHINYYDSSGSLIFGQQQGFIQALTIAKNGRIGVGTTSPSHLMHIEPVSSTADLKVKTTDSTADAEILIDRTNARTGRLQFQTSGVPRWSVVADASIESGSNAGSHFALYRFNDAGALAEIPFIIRRDSGYVGIGITTPVTKLTVADAAAAGSIMTLYNSAANGFSGLQTYSSSGSLVGGFGWGNSAAGATYADKLYMSSASGITFVTNGGERMGITHTGLVGIGMYPTTALSVMNSAPTILISDDSVNPYDGSNQGKIAFGTGGGEWGSIAVDRKSGMADDVNDMVFKNSWATGAGGPGINQERMRISYTGNIGMGTSNPSHRLDVWNPNVLGSNLNDTQDMQRLGLSQNVNTSYLDVKAIRTSAGSTWLQAGTRIQQKIDATWMGYMQFNGNGNDGGISFGTGQTTTAPGNTTERMRITGVGDVGIGNTNPGAKLDVTGDIRGTGTVASWSDVRVKKNIETIEGSLNKVLQLRGVSFDWRTDEYPEKNFKQTRDIGVIAQEVEKVFPEVVKTDKESFKSVSYSLLVAPLIEAVKELYAKFINHEEQIENQSRRIANLEEQNAVKDKEIKDLKAYLCAKDPSAVICK